MASKKAVERCWICGGGANSKEHGVKRSDLALAFPDYKPGMPLFKYSQNGHRSLQSLNDKQLTYRNKICSPCNNARTQPFDIAWDKLHAGIRGRLPNKKVCGDKIFKCFTHQNLLKAHLYFVKHFGCFVQDFLARDEIKESDRQLFDGLLGSLSDAICLEKHHPDIYLKFAYDGDRADSDAGRSDMIVGGLKDQPPDCAAWTYDVGKLIVQMTYDKQLNGHEKKIGMWHPRLGTSRIHITDWPKAD